MTLKCIIILISFVCIITFLTGYNGIIGINEASLYAQELSSISLSTGLYTPLITIPFEYVREYGLRLFDEEGNLYWGATLPANYSLAPIPYESFSFQKTWISDSNPLPPKDYYSILFQNAWISDSNPVPPVIPYYSLSLQNTWVPDSNPVPPVIPISYYSFLFQNNWISKP